MRIAVASSDGLLNESLVSDVIVHPECSSDMTVFVNEVASTFVIHRFCQSEEISLKSKTSMERMTTS